MPTLEERRERQMSSGPHKVTEFRKLGERDYRLKLHARRIRVAVQYGDREDALETLGELESLLELGPVTDATLYDRDRDLATIRRLVEAMFSSPEGSPAASGAVERRRRKAA